MAVTWNNVSQYSGGDAVNNVMVANQQLNNSLQSTFDKAVQAREEYEAEIDKKNTKVFDNNLTKMALESDDPTKLRTDALAYGSATGKSVEESIAALNKALEVRNTVSALTPDEEASILGKQDESIAAAQIGFENKQIELDSEYRRKGLGQFEGLINADTSTLNSEIDEKLKGFDSEFGTDISDKIRKNLTQNSSFSGDERKKAYIFRRLTNLEQDWGVKGKWWKPDNSISEKDLKKQIDFLSDEYDTTSKKGFDELYAHDRAVKANQQAFTSASTAALKKAAAAKKEISNTRKLNTAQGLVFEKFVN